MNYLLHIAVMEVLQQMQYHSCLCVPVAHNRFIMCAEYSLVAQDSIYITASDYLQQTNKSVILGLYSVALTSPLLCFFADKPSAGPAGEVSQVRH